MVSEAHKCKVEGIYMVSEAHKCKVEGIWCQKHTNVK